jgi:predicted O-linked N-acetylglucosamine transferase (SPINDLY family)
MLPLLQHHDSSQFEVFAYADVPAPDSVSAQVEAHVRVWRNIAGMEDSELADLVRSDQIDILVDLAAHTAGGRLLAFARKPAPVQVNYLAYCSTTGLDAIDYRLTDPFLDPEGVELSDYCEKSIYLPKTYWCYSVPGVSLPVRPRPAEQAGTVTFGCLNNFCKVTNDTLRVWGRLLALVPNSRLLIYARMSSQRRRVEDVMGAFGVDGSRIKSIDYQSFENYLATYHQIDIGLDPIPFTGGSTTCDALWMGVPVVSLAGRTAVSRGGLSLLSNVGLPELVAGSEDDYVRIAAELAEDWPRLALMRQALRARLKASPIMDPTRFARDIETAFREMWRIWCQNTLRPI